MWMGFYIHVLVSVSAGGTASVEWNIDVEVIEKGNFWNDALVGR